MDERGDASEAAHELGLGRPATKVRRNRDSRTIGIVAGHHAMFTFSQGERKLKSQWSGRKGGRGR